MARFLKLTILRGTNYTKAEGSDDTIYLNIEHIVSISAIAKAGNYPDGGSYVTMTSSSDGNSECYYVVESMKTITDNLPV